MRSKYMPVIVGIVVSLVLLVMPAMNRTQALAGQLAAIPSSVALNPSQGKEIGFVYEAFLSRQQEPGEESDMQDIAQKGELYFNLHTKGQTFYGDMRGKVHPLSA